MIICVLSIQAVVLDVWPVQVPLTVLLVHQANTGMAVPQALTPVSVSYI